MVAGCYWASTWALTLSKPPMDSPGTCTGFQDQVGECQMRGQSVPASLQVPQPHIQLPNLAEWEEAAWRRPHDQPTALEPTRSGLTAGASVEV